MVDLTNPAHAGNRRGQPAGYTTLRDTIDAAD